MAQPFGDLALLLDREQDVGRYTDHQRAPRLTARQCDIDGATVVSEIERAWLKIAVRVLGSWLAAAALVPVLVETGRACEAVPIVGAEFQIGRERGDLTFPTDGYVSSSHCRIVGDDSGVYLEDRGSSNGTYLRVRSGTVVPFGSLVLIGQQLFHVRTS